MSSHRTGLLVALVASVMLMMACQDAVDKPAPTTPWQESGTGAAIIDVPTHVTRIRIESEYDGMASYILVACREPFDETYVYAPLGMFWGHTTWSGDKLLRHSDELCRTIEVDGESTWKITKVG